MPHVLTVTQLTRAVKEVLEAEFPLLWVRGQVSNLSRPSSGHVYFSLADETAVLPVVWFKKSQWRESPSGERVNPATGEVDPGGAAGLVEGADVLVAGRLNVYEPRGVYQLVAEMVQEQGVGGAHLAFEALKRKLAAEGLFDEARKMKLPANPRRVAVITSPHGAAIKDFLRISEGRGLGGEVRIYPTAVQGAFAPASIAKTLARACSDGFAEAAVLIRGGGAAEDLSAFNTEEVVRAIADCRVPVVSGVGHEVDVSLADLAADLRAATPSHAAQALWPERSELAQGVDRQDLALGRAFLAMLEDRSRRLETMRRGLRWLSPAGRLDRLWADFQNLAGRLDDSVDRFLARREEAVSRRGRRLGSAFGTRRLEELEKRARGLGGRLERAGAHMLERRRQRLDGLRRAMQGLDPGRPLRRGFCLVEVEGRPGYLRDARDAAPGDMLRVRPAAGEVLARVEASREEAPES